VRCADTVERSSLNFIRFRFRFRFRLRFRLRFRFCLH
jgi:hypothetical protein